MYFLQSPQQIHPALRNQAQLMDANRKHLEKQRQHCQSNYAAYTGQIFSHAPHSNNLWARAAAVAQVHHAIASRLPYPTVHGLLATHWERGTIREPELFQLFSTQCFAWANHLQTYLHKTRQMHLQHMLQSSYKLTSL